MWVGPAVELHRKAHDLTNSADGRTMRRTGRFPIVAAIVVAALLSVTASSAGAQSVSQVRAGSEVAVANNGECRPDTDVALFFEGAGVAEVQVGSAVSDGSGSFAASVVIPAEASVGAAAILVDCGLDSAVLTYDLEVIGGGFSLGSLIGPVLVGLAVIAIIGLVAVLRKRRIHGDDSASTDHDDDTIEPVRAGIGDGGLSTPVAEAETGAAAFDPGRDGAGLTAAAVPGPGVGDASQAAVWQPPGAAAPAPPAPVAAVAASASLAPPAPVAGQDGPDADRDDDGGIDDGADYWFWEAATSAGPRRRVACMTETTFHLHEVSVDAFQPMLDRLVEVGPDAALAQAFVRIPVAAVDRVVREGTVVHIEGRSASGPRRQTIDLADGADGVVDMLARRLPIVDASPMQESVR